MNERRDGRRRWQTAPVDRDTGDDLETLDPFGPDAQAFVPDDDAPAATTDPTGRDPDDEDDDHDVVLLSWWQHPVNVAALVVAMALIGGMVGWLISDTSGERRGNDVDVGFLQDMRYHHEQAVRMSFIYLDNPDTDRLLRADARSIAFGQGIEIGRMIQLLRDMGADEAADPDDPGTAMAWMGDGMGMNHESMPGVATEAELIALQNATGAAADEMFVRLMVAHHEGGIEMADYAAEHAGSDDVRRFASSMAATQRDEIVEMQRTVEG